MSPVPMSVGRSLGRKWVLGCPSGTAGVPLEKDPQTEWDYKRYDPEVEISLLPPIQRWKNYFIHTGKANVLLIALKNDSNFFFFFK